MAIKTVTTPTAHGRVILINTIDELSAAAAKLDALLIHTFGVGGESFRVMNDELQDNYMWACSDIASEIKELVSQL
jgi:hypothetical protein